MFGYIKPFVPDLRVRENETYRAVYCGLCRSMGRHTGCFSRLTLSYDFVFLAAVRMLLEEAPVCAGACRCMVHPFKKRACIDDNPALSYSACAASLLTEAKICDDISDKKGISRLGARLLHPAAKRMMNKARKSGSLPENEVRECLSRLSALESAGCTSLDDTADCFGDLLSAVFSHGLPEKKARIAAEIGRSTGRCIYVMDAADDREDDRKSGSYNPLNLTPIPPGELSCAIRLELERLSAAAELLPQGATELSEIVRNTVYEGIPREADRIFSGKAAKHRKDKKND